MKILPLLILIAASFSESCVFAQTTKSWTANAQWKEAKYGAWGGPGVDPAPGPMDTILLKDYAPHSSVVTQVTVVPEAKFPAIDVHTHVAAETPEEVAEWVKTMNTVDIQTSVVLTGATGSDFDKLAELYLKSYPDRFLSILLLSIPQKFLWLRTFKIPELHAKLSKEELAYINSDSEEETTGKISWLKLLTKKETWVFSLTTLTDGVWWFYVFW